MFTHTSSVAFQLRNLSFRPLGYVSPVQALNLHNLPSLALMVFKVGKHRCLQKPCKSGTNIQQQQQKCQSFVLGFLRFTLICSECGDASNRSRVISATSSGMIVLLLFHIKLHYLVLYLLSLRAFKKTRFFQEKYPERTQKYTMDIRIFPKIMYITMWMLECTCLTKSVTQDNCGLLCSLLKTSARL